MKTSELLDQVMGVLWDGSITEPTKEAKAVASFVKNHRINSGNVLEVINTMWPEAVMAVRPPGEGVTTDDPADVWYDVQFADESQVLVFSNRGIGNSIEVVS